MWWVRNVFLVLFVFLFLWGRLSVFLCAFKPLNFHSLSSHCPSLLSLLLSLLAWGANFGMHPCSQALPGLFSQGGGEDGDRGWHWVDWMETKSWPPMEAVPSFHGGTGAPDPMLIKWDNAQNRWAQCRAHSKCSEKGCRTANPSSMYLK